MWRIKSQFSELCFPHKLIDTKSENKGQRNLPLIRHEILQTFGGFQIFSCQSTFSKVIGFHLKVIKTNFLERGYRGFRLFKLISVIFRFFHEELNLMPV